VAGQVFLSNLMSSFWFFLAINRNFHDTRGVPYPVMSVAMNRFLCFSFGLLLLLCLGVRCIVAPVVAQAPTRKAPAKEDIVTQVLKLLQAKLPENVILRKIAETNTPVEPSTDQLIALKQAGASDAVLNALSNPSVAMPAAAPTTTTVTSTPPATSGPSTTTVTTSTVITATPQTSGSRPTMTVRRASQPSGFKEKAMQMIVCGGGAVGGYKLGEKLADAQAKRMNLPPAAAKALERKYEIGLALALCNGGKLLASTVYSGLSKRDQEARQKEIDAAVIDADSGTRNYAVPDHPDMKGTITTSPEVAEGSNECRTVEDHLAEGDKGDSALVKYCRKPPSTEWSISTGAS
jgi:hypothetical protein